MTSENQGFAPINRGYATVFQPNRLTLGLVVPIERYTDGPVPSMHAHLERVRLAERLGFAAVWLRDVPFNVPSFGDAGQLYDPFVYLGLLAGHTERIALGVASVVLPLRHPAHVAKAAASADVLSGGRLLLGVASGDRPDEYPALKQSYEDRGRHFRDSLDYIQRIWQNYPAFDNRYGSPDGRIDMLPKPVAERVPLLITGASQQSPDWLASHGDGWITYPRPVAIQEQLIAQWRATAIAAGTKVKPVMQSLYIDLLERDDTPPQTIHLGLRTGMYHLRNYLKALETIGVNHVALNLRFNQADIEATLQRITDELLPDFLRG